MVCKLNTFQRLIKYKGLTHKNKDIVAYTHRLMFNLYFK